MSILQYSTNKPSVQVQIGKNWTRALLDTGAEVGVVHSQFYRQIKRISTVSQIRESPIQLVTTDQTELENIGEVDITFRVGQKTFTVTFQITPELGHSVIIGWDLMKKEGLKIDGQNQLCVWSWTTEWLP